MAFVCALENGAYQHEPRDNRVNELTFEMRGKLAPFVEVVLKMGEGLICDSSALDFAT